MMGHTHALSGCVAWLAATPFLGQLGMPLTPAQVAAGAVVCAGAAMLPDIDHHDGTIANTFGPFTRILCKVVGIVTGGHRNATHSLVFAAAAGLGTDWLTDHAVRAWWVVLFLLVGLGLRGVGIQIRDREAFSAVLNALIAAALTFVMVRLDFSRSAIETGWGTYGVGWAGLAVTLGCLVHVAGDCLTPQGCPVLWPAPWRLGLPLVPRTNGVVERWILAPLLTLAVIILAIRSQLGGLATHWLMRSS